MRTCRILLEIAIEGGTYFCFCSLLLKAVSSVLLCSWHIHSRPTRIPLANVVWFMNMKRLYISRQGNTQSTVQFATLRLQKCQSRTATSAEPLSDICRPDLVEHVNRFLHGLSRRPVTGAHVCVFTHSEPELDSGLERGRLIRQTNTPAEVKQLIATTGANCEYSFALLKNFTAICR